MTEDFLHYLWKFKLLKGELRTSEGEKICIVQTGVHNHDAGPDFSNAWIYLGETLWVGNVEIHIKSSDWMAHGHENDPVYDNVILHIVHEHDKVIYRKSGEAIPTLEIKQRYDTELLNRYQDFLQSMDYIPCCQLIKNINPQIRGMTLERMAVERLEKRYERILHDLKSSGLSWEETFYQYMLAGFGLKNNYDSFLLLAKSLPLKFLSKHKNQIHQLEAMLFGQAGFLNGFFIGKYPNSLKKEYDFLRRKFNLTPIDPKLWKFFRLRPTSFPTVRLSLFANLIYQSSQLFRQIIESKELSAIEKMLEVNSSEYWDLHYLFDQETKKQKKSLGMTAKRLIIINIIIPFVFTYGKYLQSDELMDKALNWLCELDYEENAEIKRWIEIGIQPKNALESQALLHLKKNYCDEKKCLSCALGNYILRS